MDNIEKVQAKLSRLQNEIALLEKRINLADTEQRATSRNDKSELRKNSLEMKQFRMQVDELETRLKKQQLTDDKLVQDALLEKCGEVPKKGSAKEVFQMVESRVMDLEVRSHALSENLKQLEHICQESKNSLQDMTARSRVEGIPDEADCIKYIRKVENEHHKALRNVEESEDANNKLKAMLGHLRKKQQSHFRLLMELKKAKSQMEIDDDENVEEQRQLEHRIPDEKLIQFKRLERDLSLIRDATCSYDVKDVDMLFLEKTKMQEDLTQMKVKAEKRLNELKSEKFELTSKIASVKEADAVYPRSGQELPLAKSRLREQEARLDSAKAELERLNTTTDRSKEVFQRLISRMQPRVKKGESLSSDVGHLAKKCENIVLRAFPISESTCTARNSKKSAFNAGL